MLIEKIDSENPKLHWKYIECNNKITLDLGCGRWEHIEHRDQSWPGLLDLIHAPPMKVIFAKK